MQSCMIDHSSMKYKHQEAGFSLVLKTYYCLLIAPLLIGCEWFVRLAAPYPIGRFLYSGAHHATPVKLQPTTRDWANHTADWGWRAVCQYLSATPTSLCHQRTLSPGLEKCCRELKPSGGEVGEAPPRGCSGTVNLRDLTIHLRLGSN